jgi:membrane protein implicated in regulation of membrane protease activity
VSLERRHLAAGTAIAVLAMIAVPLFAEFFEPRALGWDLFLGLFLVALVAAALQLRRFFASHAGELGEARFDTSNEGDARG